MQCSLISPAHYKQAKKKEGITNGLQWWAGVLSAQGKVSTLGSLGTRGALGEMVVVVVGLHAAAVHRRVQRSDAGVAALSSMYPERAMRK
ncbi:hypothetical protein EYF80_014562 [Liparis tanakae]|uniref:Uncharacterized protein n=1 Tax=Liparis tanakae TaxID=230148 RepID=A0A4Z2ICJ4_9TELE|nr:hypothetical protein EYF80_014562 [Liparis tanakae]